MYVCTYTYVKKSGYMCMYICMAHFAVQHKLTQYCKSIILQEKLIKNVSVL